MSDMEDHDCTAVDILARMTRNLESLLEVEVGISYKQYIRQDRYATEGSFCMNLSILCLRNVLWANLSVFLA